MKAFKFLKKLPFLQDLNPFFVVCLFAKKEIMDLFNFGRHNIKREKTKIMVPFLLFLSTKYHL